jgi:hypothetical protein
MGSTSFRIAGDSILEDPLFGCYLVVLLPAEVSHSGQYADRKLYLPSHHDPGGAAQPRYAVLVQLRTVL